MFEGSPFRINRKILIIVCLNALMFLAAGAMLIVWSAQEMREQVARQFNQAQLVLAQNIADLIERQMGFLRREMVLLARELSEGTPTLEHQSKTVQTSLARVLPSGVSKIAIIDLNSKESWMHTLHRHWMVHGLPEEKWYESGEATGTTERDIRVSRVVIKPPAVGIELALALGGGWQKTLVFHLNVSGFLSPFLETIRSGHTGYAWIIDENGIFLFHPYVDFVGKNAFKVRAARDPGLSHQKINFIQREKMLKGEQGLGWYLSGWHRGISGKIKKLIAYCPITISNKPPQRWSVAVVAPVSEIDQAVRSGYLKHFFLQGLVIFVIVSSATAILFLEIRWSRTLEKKVTEQTWELKESEEKYRSLVESAEDFIYTVDSEGRFQSMNNFTANFFGGRAEDFFGKHLTSIFRDEVAEKQFKLIRLVFQFAKSVRDEFVIKTGDHQTWISANFMPLRNEEGKVSSVLCIARDVTESKKLERQLINTEKLASIGTLAAGVAHEINNPLGVILGFCDILLRNTDKNSQEYEDLKIIERQGHHCMQVVENLLSFARLREEDTDFTDVNKCLLEVIGVVKHTMDMNNVDLVLDLADNLPLVRGDYRQLQQVFLNLINNAIAAIPEEGQLTVRTFPEKQRRRTVVQFLDNGVGIREEELDHIFEPFFTTKPEGEGTGLGLFVSYGIVTKYGGSISCLSHTANSGEGPRGTTFTIKLLNKAREV